MEEGKKKDGFLKRLGKDLRLQITFCIVSVLLLFMIYFPLHYFVENGVMREKVLKTAVTEDNYVLADVVEAKSAGKRLELFGWAIRLDAEVRTVKLVLKPLNTKKQETIILRTSMGKNSEVNNYVEYFQEEGTAGSGFKAETTKGKLQKNVCYELFVYVNYKQSNEQAVKISTKKYLYNEQVYSYNPLEFVAPNFADEQMKKVVEEGYLLGYTMEHGAWVYQYEGSMYWILDKSVGMNADENLYMFFHLNTSNPIFFSQHILKNGADNRDFVFKRNELEIKEDYRVAKVELNVEYPVSYISTGHYFGGKNIWIVRNRVEMKK